MTNFNVGDYVETVKDIQGWPTCGYGGQEISKGSKFEVTRVYNTKVTIRKINPVAYGINSFNVEKDALKIVPKPDPLDAVPAGKIAPTDPGLDWLWHRAEKYANEHNLCADYDRMVEALGIPGRRRNHTVTVEVDGLEIKATVKARSKAEAEKLVTDRLKA